MILICFKISNSTYQILSALFNVVCNGLWLHLIVIPESLRTHFKVKFCVGRLKINECIYYVSFVDPSGCFPDSSALLLHPCFKNTQEVLGATVKSSCMSCVVECKRELKEEWKACFFFSLPPSPPSLARLHRAGWWNETCCPKGRLITLHLCSAVNCCSMDLGREEVLWDVAASPQGGGTALARPSPSSSATCQLHSKRKVQKGYFSSCRLLMKDLLLLCTSVGWAAAERGKTRDTTRGYSSTKCTLTQSDVLSCAGCKLCLWLPSNLWL